jgi:hypothetical protein
MNRGEDQLAWPEWIQHFPSPPLPYSPPPYEDPP